MIGQEIMLRRRIRELETALRPFSRFTHEKDGSKRAKGDIFVPIEGDVWFYVGLADDYAAAHVHTDSFKAARAALQNAPAAKPQPRISQS